MDNIVNAIAVSLFACKYAVVVILAGLSISTGAIAADLLMMTGLETSD
ncbi:hypothetical protein P7F88_21610 [Vibrio hannami]|nr:hypothetical protein [Vibrio hannami]MDG3088519.1 hypothetical protein [Vibrio hannami]